MCACFKRKRELNHLVCDYCENFGLSDDIPYYYSLNGLGKYDQKTLCDACIYRKINGYLI